MQRPMACIIKPMMIVNNDSMVVNKPENSLTDNSRDIIYDCHMFIVQTTSGPIKSGDKQKRF
jgi:hypothetical protein